jgi:hypothetical protein
MALELSSVEQARGLLIAFGRAWFGPPVVLWKGKPVDGRKRMAAASALGIAWPTYEPAREGLVLRALIAAGHVERALARVVPLGTRVSFDRADLVRYVLTQEEEAQVLAAFRGQLPRVQRSAPRRALNVVNRLRDLYARAVENGDPATPEELRYCLGEWL